MLKKGEVKMIHKILKDGMSKREGICHEVYIKQVNAVMKSILGVGYTSHSFRQGLITEMGVKGANVKIIASHP
jgi:hypothetical protein